MDTADALLFFNEQAQGTACVFDELAHGIARSFMVEMVFVLLDQTTLPEGRQVQEPITMKSMKDLKVTPLQARSQSTGREPRQELITMKSMKETLFRPSPKATKGRAKAFTMKSMKIMKG